MKTILQRIRGRLLRHDGRYALLLLDTNPDIDEQDLLYLRYAFVTQGVEAHILPTFILDDWGGEIKTLELYDWFHEFAAHFPRAELFGWDKLGAETQIFLRELEQYSQLFCYAYPEPDTPLPDGLLVEAILLPDETAQEPVKIKRPSTLERPLRSARVTWWHVHPDRIAIRQILT